MAKYLIEIDTDNDAFEDLEYELSFILRKAAKKLDSGILEFKLQDSNGNTVGSAYLEEDAEDSEEEDFDQEDSSHGL